MKPTSPTFTIRLDALGDLVSIVIIPGTVGQVGHMYYVMVMLLVRMIVTRLLLVWKISRVSDADILFLYLLS